MRQIEDSPPPPASASKLTPRNLDRDLDVDMPEARCLDKNHMDQAAPSLEGRTTHGQPNPNTDSTNNHQPVRKISEPVYVQAFRNSCGNPTNLEERIKYLEHNAAVMLTDRRFADEKARADARAAADREIQLAAKADELHTLVENHIEDGF